MLFFNPYITWLLYANLQSFRCSLPYPWSAVAVKYESVVKLKGTMIYTLSPLPV